MANPADYQTLGKLYKLAGIDLEGRYLHGHTPVYQAAVIERLLEGMSIPTAYAGARAAYKEFRHAQYSQARVGA